MVALILLALMVYLLVRFSAIIPPLILACILAFLLAPLVDRLQWRFRMRRGLATLLVYLGLIAVLGVVPALTLETVINQLELLSLDLVRWAADLQAGLGRVVVVGGLQLDVGAAVEQAMTGLGELVDPLLGQTFGLLVEVASSFVWLVFIFVISFYLIKDAAAIWGWIDRLPPPAYQEDYLALKHQLNAIWRDFFRGQLVLAIVVTLIFTIVGLALGLPFVLALAVLAGLLEFIPSLGHGIWLVIAIVLTWLEGSSWIPLPNPLMALIVLGLHVVFQQVDLNYLIPRIIGRRVHLHPMVVILGIVAGALLAGVLGVLLAAPTIASARLLGRYLKAYLFDLPPAPTAA
jgi:predicted PurR-regulated permease PerM